MKITFPVSLQSDEGIRLSNRGYIFAPVNEQQAAIH